MFKGKRMFYKFEWLILCKQNKRKINNCAASHENASGQAWCGSSNLKIYNTGYTVITEKIHRIA